MNKPDLTDKISIPKIISQEEETISKALEIIPNEEQKNTDTSPENIVNKEMQISNETEPISNNQQIIPTEENTINENNNNSIISSLEQLINNRGDLERLYQLKDYQRDLVKFYLNNKDNIDDSTEEIWRAEMISVQNSIDKNDPHKEAILYQ